MRRNTVFFIAVKVLRVSGGSPARHQGLKNFTYSIWYLLSLVAATASGKGKLHRKYGLSRPQFSTCTTILQRITKILLFYSFTPC
jgi:hypothetical protein